MRISHFFKSLLFLLFGQERPKWRHFEIFLIFQKKDPLVFRENIIKRKVLLDIGFEDKPLVLENSYSRGITKNPVKQ